MGIDIITLEEARRLTVTGLMNVGALYALANRDQAA